MRPLASATSTLTGESQADMRLESASGKLPMLFRHVHYGVKHAV